MGALATAKSTHISVVVPMTGYFLASAFCCYILVQDRHRKVGATVEQSVVNEEKPVDLPSLE